MARGRELLGAAGLDDPPRVHDQHAVAERRDEVEVVADEDQAHAALGHQVVQDRQDLHLHRDVERRGGLVGDQEIRARGSIIAIMTRWPMPPETSCG